MNVDESVTVKGSPVRSLQKFVEAELRPEQYENVFAALPPHYAARLRQQVLATETIPVHALNLFTEAAARELGEPLDKFARRAGREGAKDALSGIYRFFAMVLTPSALLAKAARVWSSIYNRGVLEVREVGGNAAIVRLHDFPSERAGCSRLTGWMEGMADMAKVREVRAIQTRCFALGDPHCEWNLTWK